MAVVPARPSPPPPCQSLTRASSWTACAWQGRHMRAWARARAWSGKARASWARSYRTVGSRSSMRATGGAFSANLPPPPLRVRCPRARHTGWRPHLEQAAKTTALRRSSGQSARCLCLLLNGCLPIIARAISAQGIRAESGNLIPKPVLCEDSVSLLQPCNQLGFAMAARPPQTPAKSSWFGAYKWPRAGPRASGSCEPELACTPRPSAAAPQRALRQLHRLCLPLRPCK